MNIILFTDSKNVIKYFEPLDSSTKHSLLVLPVKSLNSELKSITCEALIYIDISDLSESIIKRHINQSLSLNYFIGVIHTKAVHKDTASLFHQGVVDYLHVSTLKDSFSVKRLIPIQAFMDRIKKEDTRAFISTAQSKSYITSGKDWKKIKAGEEYTFAFLYIELDQHKDVKKSYGHVKIKEIIKYFHDFVEEHVTSANGKIWMWNDFNGVALFPFDGKKCDALITAFKLMLNRAIYRAETQEYASFLSYRIAMHLGNTIYHPRGKTGKIVSDTINTIFHLGQNYISENSFAATADIFSFMPRSLSKWFKREGTFEGREIYTMKKLIIK